MLHIFHKAVSKEIGREPMLCLYPGDIPASCEDTAGEPIAINSMLLEWELSNAVTIGKLVKPVELTVKGTGKLSFYRLYSSGSDHTYRCVIQDKIINYNDGSGGLLVPSLNVVAGQGIKIEQFTLRFT